MIEPQEEQKAYREENQENRYIVPTKSGTIDQDAVDKYKHAHV
jgi:hypothetical protein